jgi:hypothetical protein
LSRRTPEIARKTLVLGPFSSERSVAFELINLEEQEVRSGQLIHRGGGIELKEYDLQLLASLGKLLLVLLSPNLAILREMKMCFL